MKNIKSKIIDYFSSDKWFNDVLINLNNLKSNEDNLDDKEFNKDIDKNVESLSLLKDKKVYLDYKDAQLNLLIKIYEYIYEKIDDENYSNIFKKIKEEVFEKDNFYEFFRLQNTSIFEDLNFSKFFFEKEIIKIDVLESLYIEKHKSYKKNIQFTDFEKTVVAFNKEIGKKIKDSHWLVQSEIEKFSLVNLFTDSFFLSSLNNYQKEYEAIISKIYFQEIEQLNIIAVNVLPLDDIKDFVEQIDIRKKEYLFLIKFLLKMLDHNDEERFVAVIRMVFDHFLKEEKVGDKNKAENTYFVKNEIMQIFSPEGQKKVKNVFFEKIYDEDIAQKDYSDFFNISEVIEYTKYFRKRCISDLLNKTENNNVLNLEEVPVRSYQLKLNNRISILISNLNYFSENLLINRIDNNEYINITIKDKNVKFIDEKHMNDIFLQAVNIKINNLDEEKAKLEINALIREYSLMFDLKTVKVENIKKKI